MSTSSALYTYTQKDVERWFGARQVVKGKGYLGAISDLRLDADRISARVQGTAPHPYQVRVHFPPANVRTAYPSSWCSCPLGGYCKHVTAVLMQAISLREQQDRVNPQVLEWIERLRASEDIASKTKAKGKGAATTRIFYVLHDNSAHAAQIRLVKCRTDEAGQPHGKGEEWYNVERALIQPPQFVTEEDLPILRLLWATRERGGWSADFPLSSRHGVDLLRRMLAAGRLLAGDRERTPLHEGAARAGTLAWRIDARGRLAAQVETIPPASSVFALDPLWYVDRAHGEAGPIDLPYPAAIVRQTLDLPALSAQDAAVVGAALAELAPTLPLPAADSIKRLRSIDAPPVGELILTTTKVYAIMRHRNYKAHYASTEFDYAAPAFRYGDIVVGVDSKREFITLASGETVRVQRRVDTEQALLKLLATAGFARVPAHALRPYEEISALIYGLASDTEWPTFMENVLPKLQKGGWEVKFAPGFRHHVLNVDAWQADVREDERGWFTLDMGIMVAGERLPLAPLLADLFAREPRWLDAAALERVRDADAVTLFAANGKRIQVEAQRLKPIVHTLIDLFDTAGEGPLRLPLLDAPRFAELTTDPRWQWRGADAVREWATRLRASADVGPVAPPRGLQLELRPYQREGLAWLQYLREHRLAGILADDMGLGKTAQTLAHLLLEKESGRLDRPALIVLPTSLIFNWKSEAARFTPGLSVLVIHGKERKASFAEIDRHDLVLTTYPLLWRDVEALAQHSYHTLILDEAQTVKNAHSRAAAIVRQLPAQHRLCLTGTPLENHLGELWAQFDFLLPGFLGDSKSFARRWRTPIEKQGDRLRNDLLRRRLAPFILRRSKEEVARELPPKSIIVRAVELDGGQRDLYETVRSAMDKKVRDEIAAKGFKRSQIVILDALLKLRQVCCDPRLIKSSAAKAVRERAKLTQLMEMLPELVAEGRRILIFSQFTQMLALIEAELKAVKLDYVLLTGDTVDRESAVQAFQAGRVPIFLVSLKAGGVGLNLTTADTVIHYDPWWNPAVENQATDRAHRIGQDKPVFVYKLIVSGSIEERILALQEKKAALAAGILSEDRNVTVKFSESDLAALLAPLPK